MQTTPLSGSHRDRVVAAAVLLVNRLAEGMALGHPFSVDPDAVDAAAVANECFAEFTDQQTRFEAAHAREIVALATRLHRVFRLLGDERVSDAVTLINEMLSAYPASLHVSRDEPWSLHYHDHTLPAHAGWSTGCAASLGSFVSSGHWRRLGICSAVGCDRVFLDITRNRSRRFCTLRCQNREKVRAFRRRGA